MATQTEGEFSKKGPTVGDGVQQFGENIRGGTTPGEGAVSADTGGRLINTLAGFLVSFSAKNEGEYWSLREGRNLLGKAKINAILLSEEHVSDAHAVIVISKNQETESWKFEIADTASTNGTFLNGERLNIYQGRILSNNDEIKIGEYILKLFITDKFLHKLHKNEKFKSMNADTGVYDDPDFFKKGKTNT